MDIEAFLRERGIRAERHEHAPVMTVEESERLVPRLPGAKTKNLFLRDRKGLRHFLVTVRHDVAVDLNALGTILGAGRLGFGSPIDCKNILASPPDRSACSLFATMRAARSNSSSIGRCGRRRRCRRIR